MLTEEMGLLNGRGTCTQRVEYEKRQTGISKILS